MRMRGRRTDIIGARLSGSDTAALLGSSRRTVFALKHRPLNTALVEAIRLQLGYRQTGAGSAPPCDTQVDHPFLKPSVHAGLRVARSDKQRFEHRLAALPTVHRTTVCAPGKQSYRGTSSLEMALLLTSGVTSSVSSSFSASSVSLVSV